ASTVDADYDWPRVSNIHHLAWPKRIYYEDSSKSAIAYRESTALLVDMPIQLHNLIHLVTPPPIKPNPEVMGQRVIEQEQAGTLFELGRLAIRYARWMQEVEAMRDNVTLARSRDLLEASSYYESLSRNFGDRYRRYLDQIEDGWVGLLPSRESLHQMGLVKATQQLGKIAAVRSIDLRRESQVAVEHLGIR